MNDSETPPPPHLFAEGNELEGFDPRALFEDALRSPPTPGQWTPPTAEYAAELLPQYQIEALIGHGGMGAVYKGSQPKLGRAVAIKLLPVELAADEDFASRFESEARTLARLHHPHIVEIYDSGQTTEGHLYFVMEFVDGMDLARILAVGTLTSSQALTLVIQICDALQYAHGRQVIHRDIKPSNVLVTLEGQAKLADFGLARPADETDAGPNWSQWRIGTPDYMAPEQHQGQADHRSDIYALGVMLYEMITGQKPRGTFTMPSASVSGDDRLDEVVAKAMKQEPERRYQLASEMRTAVEQIRSTSLAISIRDLSALSPFPAEARTPGLKNNRRGARVWIWAGGASLALAVGILASRHGASVKNAAVPIPPVQKNTPAPAADAPGVGPLHGHRYQLVEAPGIPWERAREKAEQMGGHLATITSQEEEECLEKLFGPPVTYQAQVWLGGLRTKKGPSGFSWITAEPWVYQHWSSGNPDSDVPGDAVTFMCRPGRQGWNDFEYPAGPQDALDRSLRGFFVEWDGDEAPSSPKEVPHAALSAEEVVAFETALVASDWTFENHEIGGGAWRWDITFMKYGVARTHDPAGPRIWHWWMTGPHTLHVQTSADPAAQDMRIGFDWTFNDAFDAYEGERTDHRQNQRGRRKPIARN